jgi:hypothetical protein
MRFTPFQNIFMMILILKRSRFFFLILLSLIEFEITIDSVVASDLFFFHRLLAFFLK